MDDINHICEKIAGFSYKKWLSLCALYGIRKIDFIQWTGNPVYASKKFIDNALAIVDVDKCRICSTPFDYGMYKGNFFAKVNCSCRKENNVIDEGKLKPFLDDETIKIILKSINKEKTRCFPNTMNYYYNLGYSVSDAEERVSVIQKQRSAKSPSTTKGARGYSKRTPEYWMRHGYTATEAIQKVSEIQVTNGLDYYIRKHGKVDGTRRYHQRIENWLGKMKELSKGRSPVATQLFEQIDRSCQEVTVKGKNKPHNVDFCKNNKIIEFFGDYWHANPLYFSKEDYIRQKKVENIWIHDQNKLNDLQLAGYKVKVVWETEFRNDPETIIQDCRDFINEN